MEPPPATNRTNPFYEMAFIARVTPTRNQPDEPHRGYTPGHSVWPSLVRAFRSS